MPKNLDLLILWCDISGKICQESEFNFLPNRTWSFGAESEWGPSVGLQLLQHEAIQTWLERISFLYSGGEDWDTRACVMTVSVGKKSAQLGRSHHSFHRQSFPGSTKIWLLSPTSDIKNTFLLKCSLFRKHGHSLIFFWSVFLSHRKNAVTNTADLSWSLWELERRPGHS